MGGFHELEPAVLHVRNVAAPELDFEQIAVVGAAKEHRLALERHAGLAVTQDLGDHPVGLGLVVEHGDQTGPRATAALRAQGLRILPGTFADQCVGQVQHRLYGSVVLLERHAARRGLEALREVQDVADVRGAERIDRLGIVADHHQAAAVTLHRMKDPGLQQVRVLVFVDQHVIEARPDLARERRVAEGGVPPLQQVVVVEHAVGLLADHVSTEQRAQIVGPVGAPRVDLLENAIQRPAGVHAVRIDREAGVLARKAARLRRKAELVAEHVDQVAGIAAVEHAEILRQPEARCVPAQQPRADRVKGAGPGQPQCLG